MGRKGGFLGGLISVFFLSILIFFILYFFMPDVSEKFFGFSKDQAYTGLKAAEKTLPDHLGTQPDPVGKTETEVVSEINSFLKDTDEGNKVSKAIYNAAKKANVSIDDFKKSEEVTKIFDSAKDFIKSGAGKASDFFSEGEGRRMIEGLSE